MYVTRCLRTGHLQETCRLTKCDYCHKTGHVKARCYVNPDSPSYKGPAGWGTGSGNPTGNTNQLETVQQVSGGNANQPATVQQESGGNVNLIDWRDSPHLRQMI